MDLACSSQLISASFGISAPFESVYVNKGPQLSSNRCPHSNTSPHSKKRHSNKVPYFHAKRILSTGSLNQTPKMLHQNAFLYGCKWHCQRNRLKFPHTNWPFTVYLLLLQFNKYQMFCFTHSVVSQKRNMCPVRNKHPVAKSTPPWSANSKKNALEANSNHCSGLPLDASTMMAVRQLVS